MGEVDSADLFGAWREQSSCVPDQRADLSNRLSCHLIHGMNVRSQLCEFLYERKMTLSPCEPESGSMQCAHPREACHWLGLTAMWSSPGPWQRFLLKERNGLSVNEVGESFMTCQKLWNQVLRK